MKSKKTRDKKTPKQTPKKIQTHGTGKEEVIESIIDDLSKMESEILRILKDFEKTNHIYVTEIYVSRQNGTHSDRTIADVAIRTSIETS